MALDDENHDTYDSDIEGPRATYLYASVGEQVGAYDDDDDSDYQDGVEGDGIEEDEDENENEESEGTSRLGL